MPRSRTGWRRGEKRAEAAITADYLDAALADFSGYIAADELYDGPYCVLSIVDNHRFKRLLYEVLDHNPTEEDILRFFRRFQQALTARGLALQGVTTDGSPLYPEAIVAVFGGVEHQVCQFHVLAELTKAVLKSVAKVRKQRKASLPKMGRGRPSRANRRLAARKKRVERKMADLFEHRHLFVQHDLTAAQEKTLRRISRGLPALRSLREIMDEVYRLFDRRCRTETALARLARLRRRVRRFRGLRRTLKKLFSPNLEKALTFLDDSLLPATSNAVERGNRRHRKMQKTVYRVRTRQTISRRIALDMQRDLHAPARHQTTAFLRQQRRGTGQNYPVTLLQSPGRLYFSASITILSGAAILLGGPGVDTGAWGTALAGRPEGGFTASLMRSMISLRRTWTSSRRRSASSTDKTLAWLIMRSATSRGLRASL